MNTLERDQMKRVAHAVGVLEQQGPNLGRPLVDRVQGSRHANMKELRVQVAGAPWCILFAFDPKRQAVLLIGGDKTGNARWYRDNIPVADDRFDRWLAGQE